MKQNQWRGAWQFGLFLVFIAVISMPNEGSAQQPSAEQRQALESFGRELDAIVKRLPPAAKVVIPAIESKMINYNPNVQWTEEHIKQSAGTWRDIIEKGLFAANVKVVDRDVLKAQEDEITLAQTGVVDPQASIKIGKSLGASHVVIGKLVWTSSATSISESLTAKFIDTESMVLFGVANYNFTYPITPSAPSPPQTACNLTGQWSTTYGPMAITQNGNVITGAYIYNNINGNIQGTVQGGLVEWSWQQMNGDRGWGEWQMLAGCVSLVGRWGRISADAFTGQLTRQIMGSWNANKLAQ